MNYDKIFFKCRIVERVRLRPDYKSEILKHVLAGFYPGSITPNYIIMAKYAQAAMKELINTGVIIYKPKTKLKLSPENI